MTKPIKLSHHELLASDCLTTAIEGGINYWANGRNFKRIPPDKEHGLSYLACELKPQTGEGDPYPKGDTRNNWQYIDLARIEAAMVLLMSPSGIKLCRSDIREDIRANWEDKDECRGDAETADTVIQIALFGEVVFG